MSDEIAETAAMIESTVDVAPCPLCKEMITGRLESVLIVPLDKLNDTNVIKASVKMEAVSFSVDRHRCDKVDPQPVYRSRGGRRISDTMRSRGLLSPEELRGDYGYGPR